MTPAPAAARTHTLPARKDTELKIEQVAATLYTLRDHAKTPAALVETLRKVKAIGYGAVQVSGICEIEPPELRRMLDGEGLTCCATHEAPDMVLSAPGAVVEKLGTLGCRATAYPYPSGVALGTLDEVKTFAAQLNAAGRVLHEAGMVLAYHNHQVEFRRIAGRTILEIVYEETDPRYLQAELDTYWVQYGGGDPVRWCQRLARRLPLLHLKDYAVTPENQPTFAEIGGGNLDWHAIVKAADASGCDWFIVEQDTCPGDPFDSLRASYDYITSELVTAQRNPDAGR